MAKSKFIKVLCQSIVTKHKVVLIRPRILEAIKVLRYDPRLQKPCIYKEVKKLSSYSV